jgi:hypothetical protein
MNGRDALRLGTPVIAMAAVWVANKGVAIAYEKATGDPVPTPNDLDAPLDRVLLYAAGTAVLGAAITVCVNRGIASATTIEPGAEELALAT